MIGLCSCSIVLGLLLGLVLFYLFVVEVDELFGCGFVSSEGGK